MFITDGTYVIISTRARFARNLANFPFVPNFRGDDKERIQSLIFDAFSHFENLDDYIFVNTSLLEKEGMKILSERGMLKLSKNPQGEIIPFGTGLVVHAGGNISCSINSTDHLHISSATVQEQAEFFAVFSSNNPSDPKIKIHLPRTSRRTVRKGVRFRSEESGSPGCRPPDRHFSPAPLPFPPSRLPAR